MQTYIVEYNYPQWGDGGGFKGSPDYYKYKRKTYKAQSIDNLRVRIIRELAGERPFRSHVYRPNEAGEPNYDSLIGSLYHYPHEYVWWIRDTHSGFVIDPKTGKKARE